MPMRRQVLVTRPEPGLSETMRAVASLGFLPVACPLLRIGGRVPRLPRADSLAAILLTSGQAVAPLARAAASDSGLRALPVFAVGDSTAQRARCAGFAAVVSAAGDARDLAALVRESVPDAFRRSVRLPLLLATASGQGSVLARLLREQGGRVQRRVIYAAHPARRLPEAARDALHSGSTAACLFFSGEAARNFARLCAVSLRSRLGTVQALAISPAVGDALTSLPWQSVRVAAHPSAGAVLALLQSGHQPCRSRP